MCILLYKHMYKVLENVLYKLLTDTRIFRKQKPRAFRTWFHYVLIQIFYLCSNVPPNSLPQRPTTIYSCTTSIKKNCWTSSVAKKMRSSCKKCLKAKLTGGFFFVALNVDVGMGMKSKIVNEQSEFIWCTVNASIGIYQSSLFIVHMNIGYPMRFYDKWMLSFFSFSVLIGTWAQDGLHFEMISIPLYQTESQFG